MQSLLYNLAGEQLGARDRAAGGPTAHTGREKEPLSGLGI